MCEMESTSWRFDRVGPIRRRSRLSLPMAMNHGVAPRLNEKDSTADGGKISSADSGIETGNDSNDSSVAQMEMTFVNGLKEWFTSQNKISNNEYRLAIIKSPSQLEASSAQSVAPEWTANSIDQPQSSLSPDTMDDSSLPLPQITYVSDVSDRNVRSHRLLAYQARRMDQRICSSTRTMGSRLTDKSVDILRKKVLERRMRMAAATNNIEGLKSVLNMGVSPNNCDQQGRTPLHYASGRGYMEIVDLLLKHGADAKRKDCIGNTPLHLAAVTSKILVVTLLLEAGADPLSLDDRGYNPLQLANTKLRLLKNCNSDDMMAAKFAVQSVVNMLSAYLRNRDGFGEQVEALSSICSRLTLTNTSNEFNNDIDNLLTNIDYLQLNS